MTLSPELRAVLQAGSSFQTEVDKSCHRSLAIVTLGSLDTWGNELGVSEWTRSKSQNEGGAQLSLATSALNQGPGSSCRHSLPSAGCWQPTGRQGNATHFLPPGRTHGRPRGAVWVRRQERDLSSSLFYRPQSVYRGPQPPGEPLLERSTEWGPSALGWERN